jgi:hypothetical protein
MDADSNFDKNEILFTHLLLSLSTSCMIQLGKSPNPITNTIERDLNQAEATITLLEMLQAKTQGNLTKDEKNFLDTTITNLRLNYVNEVRKDQEKAKTAQESKETQQPDEKGSNDAAK